MNFRRMFASAIVRRLAYVLVAGALAWVGIGKAHAQNFQTYSNQGAAYAGCMATGSGRASAKPGNSALLRYQNPRCVPAYNQAVPPQIYRYRCEVELIYSSGGSGGYYTCNYESASGFAEWHEFPVDKQCTARPSFSAGIVGSASATNKMCDNGCEVQPSSTTQNLRLDTRDASIFTASGTYQATGEVCTNTTATPARKSPLGEFCTALEGGGYQLCPQKDGKVCVKSTASGRTYCGDNDYPTVSTAPDRSEATGISAPTPAPGTPAPAPVPRTGETFTPDSGASVTNTTTNTTTNVTNYNNTGTPNTTPGSETPGDGSDNPGTPSDGDGGSDGEGEGPDNGTVSGGGSCDSPPAISGGNPVENFATVTLWRLDCANKADQGDLDQAATDAAAMANCSLNNIGCDDLPGDLGAQPADGTTGLEPDEDPLAGSRTVRDLADIELDDSGFLGGSSCPSISSITVGITSFPLSLQPLCDVLGYVSGFIMALAYFIGFGIIARGFG